MTESTSKPLAVQRDGEINLSGSRLAGWQGGFGGGNIGSGGFAPNRGGLGGGGGGPVAPSEGKDASPGSRVARIGDPASIEGLRTANPSAAKVPEKNIEDNAPIQNQPVLNWAADGKTPPGAGANDVNGLAQAIAANPAPAVDPATGLPVATGVLMSESEAARGPSRDGAALAGDKSRNLTEALDESDWRSLGVPARPIRQFAKRSEIPSLARRFEAENPGIAIVDGVVTFIVSTNSVGFAYSQPTAGAVANFFAGVPNSTLGGALIADPTHGTGDGREWGIRQKLDADGDSVARFSRLRDLTQPLSKKKALAEVQDKLAKVDRGDAANVHSVNAVGYVDQGVITNYPTTEGTQAGAKGTKQVEAGDDFTVTMSRTDGKPGGGAADYTIIHGAPKLLGANVLGDKITTSEDSK
ncbi:MAG: hypothetical protein ACREUU_21525, partial [Gammaproteobacteria bacterium]